MKFSEIVKQAVMLLRESRRITYRALKREFSLDDETLADLKDELIKARRLAVDENGEVLVWAGEGGNGDAGRRRNGETGGKTEVANGRTGDSSPTSSELHPQPFSRAHPCDDNHRW